MENGLLVLVVQSKSFLFGIIFFVVLQQLNMSPEPKQLKNGHLICRLGNGYFSDYFRIYASKEAKYSHMGIVSIENDTTYVYHSEASELTGIGLVKKEPISLFLKNSKVYDFFELKYPDSIKSKVLKFVKSYHKAKTPFDLDFNSFDDKELYCTELIATSINKAVGKLEIKPNLILKGKKVFALDDIYLNKNVNKIFLPKKSFK